jgi:hypothetical protein
VLLEAAVFFLAVVVLAVVVLEAVFEAGAFCASES